MLTVRDFVSLLLEDSRVELWSIDEQRVIYNGSSYDIPMKLMRLEVDSIDGIISSTDRFTLNV